jgi:hypothetical protein
MRNISNRLKVLVLIAVGLLSIIALMGIIHRSIDVPLSNGGSVRITPASLWRSCWSAASCKITYQPKGMEAGTIVLWQDFFDEPIIVMPAADGKKLMCLYEFDVDLRLFKIDPTKPFKPIPATSWGCLDRILYSSTWEVEEAEIGDWQEALEYLKNLQPSAFMHEVVPTHDIGIVRLGLDSKTRLNILQRMEGQIKFMVESGAIHWPVNSDTTRTK